MSGHCPSENTAVSNRCEGKADRSCVSDVDSARYGNVVIFSMSDEARADFLRRSGTSDMKRAAFFDIDETLIRGASSFHVTRELYRRDFFGFSDIFYAARQAMFYMVFGESQSRIHALTQRALHVIAGHSVEEMLEVGQDVCRELVSHRIFPGTLRILEKHLEQGHEVWLLSATPVEIAGMLADHFHATGAVGTEVKTRDGIYVAELLAPLMHGAGKADAVRRIARERGIDLADSYAYSDSFNDLPMLMSVGHPHAINPDLKLRALALKYHWKIHDFRRLRRGMLETGAKRLAESFGVLWVLRRLFYRFWHRR